MSRWDIAEWVGPTPNKVIGGMSEYRGLVVHIMQGSYPGSLAWMKNPDSDVSSHFLTRADGHIGQLVDTADTAWTQAAGNGHWLSVENEGFSGNELTAGQVEAVAQIYARGVRDHGWPYQLADSPTGFGLGWHGMGGTAWGGHPDCPGEPIKAQRQQILARAQQINGGTPPTTGDVNDMILMQPLDTGKAYIMDGTLDSTVNPARPVLYEITGSQFATYQFVGIPLAPQPINSIPWNEFTLGTETTPGGGSGTGPSAADIATAVRPVVRDELNKTKLTS
jgi:hypothetical protein